MASYNGERIGPIMGFFSTVVWLAFWFIILTAGIAGLKLLAAMVHYVWG